MAVKYGEPESNVTRWWVRWYGLPEDSFEYEGPWWISGYAGTEDMTPIFVAAVVADSVEAAQKVIESSYDDGPAGVHEWSFVNGRPDDWEPFCDRFPRAKWMKWPYPDAAPPPSAGTPAECPACRGSATRRLLCPECGGAGTREPGR